MAAKPYDPAAEGAETAFARRMSYGDYLALDASSTRSSRSRRPMTRCCSSSSIRPRSSGCGWPSTSSSPARRASPGRVPPAIKMLARVARIFEQLNGAWDVLRTMTPSEYTVPGRARPVLGLPVPPIPPDRISVGNRNPAMLRPHAHRPDTPGCSKASWRAPGCTTRCCGCRPNGLQMPEGGARRATCRSPRASPEGVSGGLAPTSTGRRRRIGCSTSLPRSSSTSRTTSAAGASTT